MKVVYRIALVYESNLDLMAALRRAGVSVPDAEPVDGVFVAEIAEDDPRLPDILAIPRLDAVPRTLFSEGDLASSDFVVLDSQWMNGYPEPSNDGGWRNATFDLSEYCGECGIGLKQNAPFRLRHAPKWGRRSIFQLNWIGDQHFVPPDVWKSHFEPFGIGCRPVIHHKSGKNLDNVVQLEVPSTAPLDMEDPRLYDVRAQRCTTCGRLRYDYILRGYAPRPLVAEAHMFQSAQYFGTGHKADHYTYVSSKLYRGISNLRGVTFRSCLPPFPELR